jgi:hypothetical protein
MYISKADKKDEDSNTNDSGEVNNDEEIDENKEKQKRNTS